ncbi:hypothetical protein [Pseudomonas sp. NPDC089569]|uniref:hypothetical protein n=1 Tax=Pseudomonas sp. NPDC089569 TaxID=3390722 RepID=UPI003D085A8E
MLTPVGASTLAMEAGTARGIRLPALSFTTIASMLAPTESDQDSALLLLDYENLPPVKNQLVFLLMHAVA